MELECWDVFKRFLTFLAVLTNIHSDCGPQNGFGIWCHSRSVGPLDMILTCADLVIIQVGNPILWFSTSFSPRHLWVSTVWVVGPSYTPSVTPSYPHVGWLTFINITISVRCPRHVLPKRSDRRSLGRLVPLHRLAPARLDPRAGVHRRHRRPLPGGFLGSCWHHRQEESLEYMLSCWDANVRGLESEWLCCEQV